MLDLSPHSICHLTRTTSQTQTALLCYQKTLPGRCSNGAGKWPQEAQKQLEPVRKSQLQSDADDSPQAEQLQRAASDLQPSGRRRGRDAQRHGGAEAADLSNEPSRKRRNPRRAGDPSDWHTGSCVILCTHAGALSGPDTHTAANSSST